MPIIESTLVERGARYCDDADDLGALPKGRYRLLRDDA